MGDNGDTDESFDAPLYLAANPDLSNAFETGAIRNGTEHWQYAGRGELRIGIRPSLSEMVFEPPVHAVGDPAPSFDAAFYLDTNADLRLAFGDDQAAARRHWAEHGSIEGRFGVGDAPYARRSPSLAALLDRPFGVDFYLAAEETGIVSTLGHRLLRALRQVGIPVSLRLFVERHSKLLLAPEAAARPGTFRVSLIAASPYTMRRLLRAHAVGHFDASYVIAAWPYLALSSHALDYLALGGIDELWMPSQDSGAAWASFAPVPVRTVAPSPVNLRSRDEARALLGLADDGGRILLLDGDGPDGEREVLRATAARLLAPGGVRLLVRVGASRLVEARRAMTGIADVTILADQRIDGGSLLLAASDGLIARAGIEPDITDAVASGRMVLGGKDRPSRPLSLEETGATINGRLRALELDAPSPVFARRLGRSRQAALPVPGRDFEVQAQSELPVLSLVVETPSVSRAALDDSIAVLASQPYPFWELCLAAAPAGRRRDDPRVRTIRSPVPLTRAARLNVASTLATGWLLPVRDLSEAVATAGVLTRIAAALEHEADILVAAEPGEGADVSDRVESGGPASRPVAIRAEAAHAAGLFSDLFDPATEHDLLLRMKSRGARFATASDLPVRKEIASGADEAGRLALGAHLRSTVGPLARAEPGLVANTWRRRLHLPRSLRAALVVTDASLLRVPPLPAEITLHRANDFGDLLGIPAERLILLDACIERAPLDALLALLEWIEEQEIGVAGGRIVETDTTIDSAGLDLQPNGELLHFCRGLPNDPSYAQAAFMTRNPPAVTGALATRRTLLLQVPFVDALAGSDADFDLLAADFCLRLARNRSLRTVYVPQAEFVRVREAIEPVASGRSLQAARVFAERWRGPQRQE